MYRSSKEQRNHHHTRPGNSVIVPLSLMQPVTVVSPYVKMQNQDDVDIGVSPHVNSAAREISLTWVRVPVVNNRRYFLNTNVSGPRQVCVNYLLRHSIEGKWVWTEKVGGHRKVGDPE